MPITLIEQLPTFEKKVTGDNKLAISELFVDTIQGEGINAGYPATFLRLQGCTLECTWCFDKNTRIVLDKGNKKIKDISIGDKLLTLDSKENIVETTVQNVLKHRVSIEQIMSIAFDGLNSNPVICTKDHLFYKKNEGWIEAKNLKLGDIVLSVEAKQLHRFRAREYNNQKNPIFLEKRIKTQERLRKEGIMKPYIRTEENRELQSIKKRGSLNPMKNPEVSRKSAKSHFYKKSRLEERYEQKFKELGLPIIYVGNNQLTVGGNGLRYRFPDFSVEDKKQVIEIYDTTYQYVIDGKRQKRGQSWIDSTRNHYSKCGYDVLFLNEKDIKDENLQDKLFNYVYNGSEITKINYQLNDKQKAAMYGSKDIKEVEIYNLSCYPYNTFLLYGHYHHKWVHNCDTLDVWPYGNEYSFDEILDLLEPYHQRYKNGKQHIILTGGSPLKQQSRLIRFIGHFEIRFGFRPVIEVENEAVLLPSPALVDLVHTWNNSPKLSNSGMKERVRIKPDVLKYTAGLTNSWFKFVVSSKEDWNEIEKDFLPHISLEQVILMPEGQTQEELNQKREFVADLAISKGVRFSDRLQVTIWNKKTGV